MRFLIILIIVNISIYSSLYANEINFYTIVCDKVNVYTNPDINSRVAKVLQIGETVTSNNNKSVKAKFGNIEGNWVFLKSSIPSLEGEFVNYQGWVFDYYLLNWNTPDCTKGFEKIKKIQLEKSTIEIIAIENPAKYTIEIIRNGTVDVFIHYDNFKKTKEIGQICRYRCLYICNTKKFGFSFYIDDDKYLRFIDLEGQYTIKPIKIKVFEEPVVEPVK